MNCLPSTAAYKEEVGVSSPNNMISNISRKESKREPNEDWSMTLLFSWKKLWLLLWATVMRLLVQLLMAKARATTGARLRWRTPTASSGSSSTKVSWVIECWPALPSPSYGCIERVAHCKWWNYWFVLHVVLCAYYGGACTWPLVVMLYFC